MDNKNVMTYKGERMEETLREYFMSIGFYVARGVKFRFQHQDITDVDLWLYNRISSINRYRINVDIKNKKRPQALERIFWAKGIKEALKLDDCIVATTDNRPVVRSFGLSHGVKVIDGNFMSRIKASIYNRIPEDTFLHMLTAEESRQYATDWREIYESSKSRLISEIDYSGCNSALHDIGYFFEQIITNTISRNLAVRTLYVVISHFLIILDYLINDLNFLDVTSKAERLSDGFKFGNLGKDGINMIVDIAIKISNTSDSTLSGVKAQLDDGNTDIIKEYFSKNEVARNIFKCARELENFAFESNLVSPLEITHESKAIISVLLDFHQIDRKTFFDVFKRYSDPYLDIVMS